MKIKSALILSTAILILTGCAEEYINYETVGVVVKKEYDPQEVNTVTSTDQEGRKHTKTTTKPEEWEVDIQYGETITEFEFSDSRLFDMVDIGTEVPISVREGLSAEGEVVSTRINFEEVTYYEELRRDLQ